MNYNNFIPVLKRIVKKASDIILDVYYSDFESSIELKDDESPVTIADKLANDYIVEELIKNFPHIPVIAEESKQCSYEVRKHYEYLWLVDPLDGTKEFIKKNDEFTVNIALIYENEPILGIVFVPVYNELYYGIKGEGAYKIVDGVRSMLTSNQNDLNLSNLKLLLSRSHLGKQEKVFLNNFNNPIINNMGSSLKFLKIADGHSDIYFRFSPTMEWDTAASQIILEESGGVVENIHTGHKLRYNKTSLVNAGFIAKGKQV